MVDHIRRSDTSVAGAFIYDNIPLRAPLLASEEEHEPIHRVDLLRRMLLHQQAGEEEEDHAWPVSGEPCLHRAARRRGGIKKEGPRHLWSPFLSMPPEGFMILTLPTSLTVPSGHFFA